MSDAPATREVVPQGENPPPGAPAARRRRWPWVVVVAVVGALAALLALRGRSPGRGSPSPAAGGAEQRPVPVLAAAAKREDVPVFLEGLGNVVAYRTVTVKPQVDGRLEQVFFREGQAVRRGDPLAQIDPRPFRIQLEQGQGALARDQALLENARRNVERDRQLVAGKLIAPQQLDTDVATVGQLEGAVQVDRAAIATARLNLDYARITSPIDGVTGIRQVDPGNLVHATDQNGIVVITQIDPIAVLFTLPQDQLTAVAAALASGPLTVDAFSADGSSLLASGRLELIDNQINQSTSTIRLKAAFENPRHLLWPNQFVNARLHLDTLRGALVVPAQAVQRGPGGAFVYVIGRDMIATTRPIRVQATQGDLAIVASGVSEGEQVVVEGQNLLKPGSRVVVRRPAAASAIGAGVRTGSGAGVAGGASSGSAGSGSGSGPGPGSSSSSGLGSGSGSGSTPRLPGGGGPAR